jgi:hypothetical protein
MSADIAGLRRDATVAAAWGGIVAAVTAAEGYVVSIPLFAVPALFFVASTVLLGGGAAWGAIAAVRRAWRRRLGRALVMAAVPVAAAAAFLDNGATGDFIRFTVERSRYERAIELARSGAAPRAVDAAQDRVQAGPPTLAVFPWGGIFVNWVGVVYDGTDTLSAGTPEALRRRAEGPVADELAACLDDVRPLGAHYYLGHFHC